MVRSFLVFWLFLILLAYSESVTHEVTRKLCPPMEHVNQPRNRIDTSDRIKKLREEMIKIRSVQGPPLDAYIVTRYDEHMNDFTADFDKRLEYVSGYSGNYGLAVITKNKLAFWTDELHVFQADNELSCNWTLYKTDTSMLSPSEWLIQELQSSMRVGADPKLVPNSEWEAIGRSIAVSQKSLILIPVVSNLVDLIWPTEERPPLTNMGAYLWLEEYAGRTWREKLNALRGTMKDLEVDTIVVSSLSEIAWLLNIRGFDLPYGPYLKGYLIVTKDQVHLYTPAEKLKNVKDHLATESCVSAHCVRQHDYDMVWNDLRKLSLSWKKILLPSMSHFSPGVSRAVHLAVSVEKRKAIPSPLIHMIAEKNEAEKKGMKNAQARDGAIFCTLMAQVEDELLRSSESLDELMLVNLTNQFRLNNEFSRSISYPTAIASGPNTGIPLYVPNESTNMIVERDKLLIIDSGAHYWDGTTALARTFRIEPSSITDEDIQLYTRLLMGLINLASLSFPPHLHTSQLDIIARTPLWEVGLDYPHGSGHGIGVFMDFYESPIDIDYRNGMNNTLKDGYFLLAEVGYYQEEQFGMKLSCVLQVIFKNDSSGYLTFEPVTLVPFEPKMINYTMLSLQQKTWLNDYNERIRSVVIEELRRQYQNNGYNWVLDRIEHIPLIPEETDNNGSFMKSNFYCLLLIFSIHFVFSRA